MSNDSAKQAGSRPAKPQTATVSSKATASAAGLDPNAGSKSNSLLKVSAAPVTAEMRRAMIAQAAYYIAEQRGFGEGRDVEDWLLAEKQIDATLSA